MSILNVEFVTKLVEGRAGDSLGEDISNLIRTTNVTKGNLVLQDRIMNKVEIKLKMLYSSVQNWVRS